MKVPSRSHPWRRLGATPWAIESLGPTKPKEIVAAGSFISEPSLELLVSAWVIYPCHGSRFSFHGYPHYILYLLASSGYPPLNNTFLYNEGGAIKVGHFHGKCVIANNMICANNGEGTDIQECNAIVANNVIANNFTGYGAAIVCTNEANATVVNNTIVNNEDTGIIADWDSTVFIYNTILLGNKYQTIKGETGVINVSYSLVEGGYPGPGNLEEEPLFINPTQNMGLAGYFADADFHLDKNSPCIDAGDPNYLARANEVDIDGDARIIAGRIDVGADEFNYAELSDLNSDGAVNFRDFDVLARYWMDYICSEPDWCQRSDLNRTSRVDSMDLLIFTECWLEGGHP